MDFRVGHSDTCLVSGIRKMGKTHLVKTFIAGQVGRVEYHPDPRRCNKFRKGVHHIIDDFDKVPMRKLSETVESVQEIAMAGRHSNTGLTIIVHHPTWTAKEFRLTPDHIFAFRQPSGAAAKWYQTYFGKNVDLLPNMPKYQFLLWSGEHGIYQGQLVREGRWWNLVAVPLDQERPPGIDITDTDGSTRSD